MPQEVRLWCIKPGDVLEECPLCKLGSEQRLETWLAKDISLLSPDLLTIGRQIPTDFGGIIDLLCLDSNGNVVIVELKRDLTPREVTAQALDYASWVKDLSHERISAIANEHLKEAGPLEEAFERKFQADLPEVLNESHSIIIVASEIDPSTERIIKYLSETYGISINAATFQFLRAPSGEEMLARVFLVEPDVVEYQAERKSSAKRRRHITIEELENVADERGWGDLYRQLQEGLRPFFSVRDTTGSSLALKGDYEGRRRVIFSLVPEKGSREEGLYFELYSTRFCTFFNVEADRVISLLPENHQDWAYPGTHKKGHPEWQGYAGYFQTAEEAQRFIDGVRATSK